MEIGRERRRSARLARVGSLEYTPYALLHSRLDGPPRGGTIVDASDDEGGLGFVTVYPLFTGRKMLVVRAGQPRKAVVRWVGASPQGYRVGVALG